MTTRFVPSGDALRAMAAANPDITRLELAKIIGCNASHLSSKLQRHGIDLKHGRRTDTTDRQPLAVRKIPPARAKRHRTCITCCEGFMSEGPGHRMCSDCRRTKSEY